jgi:hypothetical protein
VSAVERLKEELMRDCQLATDLANYADDCRRRAEVADRTRDALNLPASYQLRRKLFKPGER